MIKELQNKIGQLEYEISLLGLDQKELTGVTIRVDELKDLFKNQSIEIVSKSFHLIEGKTKSNVKKYNRVGRQAPPPPPVRTIKGNIC